MPLERSVAARDPLDIAVWILCASQDEQQVRQAIEVAQSEPVDVERFGSEPSASFCAPSYCAGIVEESAARSAARENEAVKLWEICIELVAMLLQAVDLLLVYPKGWMLRVIGDRRAQVGSDIEEIVLNGADYCAYLVAKISQRYGHSQRGVGFVTVCVRSNAGVHFGDP